MEVSKDATQPPDMPSGLMKYAHECGLIVAEVVAEVISDPDPTTRGLVWFYAAFHRLPEEGEVIVIERGEKVTVHGFAGVMLYIDGYRVFMTRIRASTSKGGARRKQGPGNGQ